MANREFNWQELALPMTGLYTDREITALLQEQALLDRPLTAKETYLYKRTPGGSLPSDED